MFIQQSLQDGMAERFTKSCQIPWQGEVEATVSIKHTRRCNDVDMGVIREVVPKRVDCQDDTGFAMRLTGGFPNPRCELLHHDLAKQGEAFRVLAKDATKDPWNGKYPVPMGNGCADCRSNGGCRIECAALVTGGANASLFAGEGKEILVVAVFAADPQETLGEVATAKELLKGVFKIRTQGSKGWLILSRIKSVKIRCRCLEALIEG